MDDDEIMRQINARAGGGDDLDDELAGLEAELEKEEGKKQDSDDELAALEKEGLDNLSDEEEKPKPQKKPEPKPVPTQPKKQPPPNPKPQQQPIPQKKPEPPKAKPAPKSASNANDLYPEKTESKYHVPNKMNSLGVLQKEKELCDKIIAYKKKNGMEFDAWEDKKESIQDQYDLIMGFIQNETWDFEVYKKKIKEQYAWEKKLLFFADKDPTLNAEQKNIIKTRVNDRLKIIEEELTKNPDEEAEKESQQQKKEAPKASAPAATSKKQSPPTTAPAKEDNYPEAVEKRYHNIAKMDSIGVLNAEKELCDRIIEYKKKIGKDYDDWEFKKENIDDRVQILTSQVEDGILDLAGYKKKIQEQYKWESKLLTFVEKDPNITKSQKEILIDRVNKRKKLIEEELTQNPEEAGEDEEEPKEVEKPAPKEVEKVKPKVELMTQKSLSPLFDVPKDKEQEEIKRLTDVVTERLSEYRNALDYFKTNDFPEQKNEAIARAKKICIELKKIQDGKWKEVNEFKLPDPVTPEFIYGYDKAERKKRFDKIISEMSKQRDAIQEDMNKRMEAIKKLPKSKIKAVLPAAKKDLDGLKVKKDKIEKIVVLLKEKSQDKWVPAPLYIETEEEVSIEKVNEDVPESTLRIMFGKTKYAKNDRLYLIVKVPDYNLETKFDQKGSGDWSHQVDFKVNENFSRIYQAKLLVEIWEKKTILRDRFKGKFEVNLTPLKTHNSYENPECKIELDSKREGVTCYIGFKVRKSLREKEYTTIRKPVFQVTKIYAPFSIKGDNKTESIKMEVQTTKVTSDDLKIDTSYSSAQANTKAPAQKPNKAPANTQAKPKQAAPARKPGGGAPKAHVDRSEFSEEELKDPDCINNLNTLMVLEFKQKKYEDISSKIDGRTPRELMQRIVKIKCKKNQLNDAMGEDIGPEDYLALLRSTFEHDKKLATYFNQQKDSEKSKLVSERLPLLIKEMEELMKQMPK